MTDTLERDVAPRSARQRKRGRRWTTMMFVVLLISLGLVATGVLPVQQFLERETQVNDARARLDVLQEDNTSLEEDAIALLSDQEIERIAREQYGFVRPGEIGYVVIPSEGLEPASEPSAQPVEIDSDQGGFLQRIWDFITGRDVADDG